MSVYFPDINEMAVDSKPADVKIICLGDSAVGKSKLVNMCVQLQYYIIIIHRLVERYLLDKLYPIYIYNMVYNKTIVVVFINIITLIIYLDNNKQ